MKLKEYLTASGHVWKDIWFRDNNDELQALFNSLENYILELGPGEHIPFYEVYTSQVYPKTIILDGQNCILWDNHFWRLFGHFINLFFLFQDDFRNNDILMYLKSLQLLFLSSRFDRVPALSRFLAEEYKKLSHKIPSHNENDDIIETLKRSGHFEKFNMCRIFGYCHEIAHIAIKQNNTLAWTVKNFVVKNCNSNIELCEFIKPLEQLLNKEKAMQLLKIKLNDEIQHKQEQELGAERKSKIGTGDRSEKIRTYNYPQNRVTDHRINYSLMELDRVMDGHLDPIIEALQNEDLKLKLAGESFE